MNDFQNLPKTHMQRLRMRARLLRLRFRGWWFDTRNRKARGNWEGVCCCGSDMDHHEDPYNCGHSPVDAYHYYRDQYVYANDKTTHYRK